ELDLATKTARDYENKAILLLQKAQQGEISPDEADYLAAQALAKKEQIESKIPAMQRSMDQYHQMVEKLEKNISELKSKILDWENELRTLKARDTVSKVTAKINRQLSLHDTDNRSHLAQLKSKVEQQEALAESLDLLKDTNLDDEIEKALGKNQTTESKNSLEKLKAKLSTPNKRNHAENKPDATFSETSALEKLKRRLQNID
ncbi:MAG: PspA/IM30 family protein, partial [Flammeovirgaceae bacterium]|nr:PspA/IM30 family protein [Flammeovirgaceae bacterium]MDW8288458.1 PspA/IM30 family protein [Flammeovirgaceae bacterium]